MPPEQKPLKDLLAEHLGARNLNLEKTYQLTEIPKHYLEAILRGDWHKLPAAPYARGYFKKLAAALELNGNELWDLYQNETNPKVSGATDRLPENRFAIRRRNYKWVWPALAIAIFAGYLAINLDRLIGRPDLTITSPLGASVVTNLSDYTFSGKLDARDKLYINGEEVYVDKSGQFQKNYTLQPGLNTFEFTAKRFLGQEIKVVKQIIYQIK